MSISEQLEAASVEVLGYIERGIRQQIVELAGYIEGTARTVGRNADGFDDSEDETSSLATPIGRLYEQMARLLDLRSDWIVVRHVLETKEEA